MSIDEYGQRGEKGSTGHKGAQGETGRKTPLKIPKRPYSACLKVTDRDGNEFWQPVVLHGGGMIVLSDQPAPATTDPKDILPF